MGYDMAVFNVFLVDFQIQTIADYDANLAQLKAALMTITPTLEPRQISKLDNDLSNICVSKKYGYIVITSEQGFNSNIANATNIRNLKIPDVCRHFEIECSNWLMVFREIGFNT